MWKLPKKVVLTATLLGICVIAVYVSSNGQHEAWLSHAFVFATDVSKSLTNIRSSTNSSGRLSNKNKVTVQYHVRLLPDDYRRRLLALEEACLNRSTPQIQQFHTNEMDNSLLTERSHAILYCSIPKVGSTFWKRTLTAMKANTKYSSPFDMRLSNAHLEKFGLLKDKLSAKQINQFLKQAYLFMFVRDPYARLYSGYENKIYHPNMIFWRMLGTKIVKLVRRNATWQSLEYGHDVLFSEFVEYILESWENGTKINNHFAPMHSKCNPCDMPYHFLGKLETFQEDTYYLLNLWQTKFPDFKIKFDDFERETAIDTGKGHIRFAFRAWYSTRHKIGYPLYNLLLRAWSDLQIRGFLSKNIPLPYTQSEVAKLNESIVISALRKALDIPVNRTEVRLQRSEALAQAYRTIPLENMERLRKFVLEDCQLFGYDDRPQMFFDRQMVNTNEHIYMKGI